jgi:glycosyltransferase involved in cell wall biosynthesis
MMRRNIHFYSDSTEWGGQEVLAARIASALADSNLWNVTFLYSCSQFNSALSPEVIRGHLPYAASTPFPILRDRIPVKKAKAKQILLEQKIQILVVCPGNIERCLPAIYAAKELGIHLVSYIPMCYTQVETGAKLGHLRDWMALSIYPLIDEWIVNSNTQEYLLRRFIAKETPVYQIPNPLAFETSQPAKVPNRKMHVATIGRIYFAQKGQDIIPPLAREIKKTGTPIQFSIIGKGPHQNKLERLIEHFQVSEQVDIRSWIPSEEIQHLLQEELTALFIPSHFESGPIVLFEALQCGIPAIIADADYVKDYQLPHWMVYKKNNLADAVDKLCHLPENWIEAEFNEMRNRLFSNRTDTAFRDIVATVFKSLTPPKRRFFPS